MAPHSSTLAWKNGQRSLKGCSPCHEESDTTERLHFHFSLSCIREGNGDPLQCSCLENPRDRGAWWAAIYGVAQSQTRLKQLSSSSRYEFFLFKILAVCQIYLNFFPSGNYFMFLLFIFSFHSWLNIFSSIIHFFKNLAHQ